MRNCQSRITKGLGEIEISIWSSEEGKRGVKCGEAGVGGEVCV